ncbi:MAG: alpha/beta fold hydrolase [Candidatus Bipolaricaulis sp.]|nr:alpha/beta fold hydrolase [Candidatus Bipolaricaulis sp.]MDD5646080.1 alpha/beta fold hydrolase [Candidatus Bipolaricaulis sp.]
MNAKLLLILGIVIGVLVLALTLGPRDEPVKADVERGVLVAAGRFAIEQKGARLLEESYTLLRTTEGYVLVSEGKIHAAHPAIPLSQETNYDRDFRPQSYLLTAKTPAGKQTVSARSERGGLALDVRAGVLHQSATIQEERRIALLDNNVVSHYVVLLEGLRAGAIGRTFTAAIPQALAGLPGTAEGPDAVSFRSGDQLLEGTAFRIRIGDVGITLVEREGRLVGLVNETQGTVGFDVDALPGGFSIETGADDQAQVPESGVDSEIAFSSGDLTLAGTLTLPADGSGPYPAALLIHGSGPVDRDGNAPGFETNAYRQVAEALAAVGVASLRFDKRGVGQSGGDAASASRRDLLSDVQAALAALRVQPEVDATRVVLIGHSEGAYLAPIVAAEDPSVAGVVLLCGAARSLAEITRWQVEEILRLRGATEEDAAIALAQEDEYLAFVKTSEGEWTDYSADELQSAMPWLTEGAAAALQASLALSWLREHYTDDPEMWLRQLAVPVLVINGEKDMQVPASEGERIRTALGEGKDPEVTVHVFADLNHSLRFHPEPPSLMFAHLEQPVDPRVLDAVIAWTKRHFLD